MISCDFQHHFQHDFQRCLIVMVSNELQINLTSVWYFYIKPTLLWAFFQKNFEGGTNARVKGRQNTEKNHATVSKEVALD